MNCVCQAWVHPSFWESHTTFLSTLAGKVASQFDSFIEVKNNQKSVEELERPISHLAQTTYILGFSHFCTPSSWSSFSFAIQVGTMTYPDFFHRSRQQLSEWESSHDWWLAEILPEVPNMSGNWRLLEYDLQSPKLTVCTCQEAFPKGKDPLQNQSFSGAVGAFTRMISLKFLQVVSWFTSSLAKASWGLVIQLISTCRCLSGSMVVFIRRKTPSISSSPWGLQTFNETLEMHPKLSAKHLGDMKFYDQIETAPWRPWYLMLPWSHMFHRSMLIPWSLNSAEHTTVHLLTSTHDIRSIIDPCCRITIDRSPAIPLDWIGTMQKLPLRRRQTCRPPEVERLNFKHRKARSFGETTWIWLREKFMVYNLLTYWYKLRWYLIFSSQRSRYLTSWAVAELSCSYRDRSPVVSGTGRRTWNAKAAAGEAGKVGP